MHLDLLFRLALRLYAAAASLLLLLLRAPFTDSHDVFFLYVFLYAPVQVSPAAAAASAAGGVGSSDDALSSAVFIITAASERRLPNGGFITAAASKRSRDVHDEVDRAGHPRPRSFLLFARFYS